MSSKRRRARTRKHRRQHKAVLRHGPGAKPSHRLKSGRTGKAHSVKLKSLLDGSSR